MNWDEHSKRMVMFMVIMVGWMLLMLLASCQMFPEHVEVRMEQVPAITLLPVQPGDEKLAEVPVGSLRNALYTAEMYDELLERRNQEARAFNDLAMVHNHLVDSFMVDLGLALGIGFITGAFGVLILVH